MRWNAPELDHIIPLSAGGAHTLDNVACAHRSCNLEKGDTLPAGWPNPQRLWVHRGSGGLA
jgi:5-methylcytosine-specific restriction endonuclease McrA